MSSYYEEFSKALSIFDKYDHFKSVSAEHDEIYAGPSPSKVSPEDISELDKLGWHPVEEYDCFRKFV